MFYSCWSSLYYVFQKNKVVIQVYRYLKSFTDIPVSLTIPVGIPEYRYLSTALVITSNFHVQVIIKYFIKEKTSYSKTWPSMRARLKSALVMSGEYEDLEPWRQRTAERIIAKLRWHLIYRRVLL